MTNVHQPPLAVVLLSCIYACCIVKGMFLFLRAVLIGRLGPDAMCTQVCDEGGHSYQLYSSPLLVRLNPISLVLQIKQPEVFPHPHPIDLGSTWVSMPLNPHPGNGDLAASATYCDPTDPGCYNSATGSLPTSCTNPQNSATCPGCGMHERAASHFRPLQHVSA